MDNYSIALVVFIVALVIGKCIDWMLEEYKSRELRAYINLILEAKDEPLTQEAIFEEMEIVKESLIQAYKIDDTDRVLYLGKMLNALRALKYS